MKTILMALAFCILMYHCLTRSISNFSCPGSLTHLGFPARFPEKSLTHIIILISPGFPVDVSDFLLFPYEDDFVDFLAVIADFLVIFIFDNNQEKNFL